MRHTNAAWAPPNPTSNMLHGPNPQTARKQPRAMEPVDDPLHTRDNTLYGALVELEGNMRIGAAFGFVIFLWLSMPALATCNKSGDPDCTCTAPGHNDCSITCDPGQGCIALYDESGECGDDCCRTTCTDNSRPAARRSGQNASFVGKNVTRSSLERLFSGSRKKNLKPK